MGANDSQETSGILLTQDDNTEISAWLKEDGNLYEKFKMVYARLAKDGETITTVTSSGEETTNTAKDGDYIIKNQTDAEEQYVIKSAKFDERYEHCSVKDDVWSEYKPIGRIYAVRLTEEILKEKSWPKQFLILAAWGEEMKCASGDFLACPEDGSEFYRIDHKEFEETYRIAEA